MFIVFVGVDTHGVSSLYVAADNSHKLEIQENKFIFLDEFYSFYRKKDGNKSEFFMYDSLNKELPLIRPYSKAVIGTEDIFNHFNDFKLSGPIYSKFCELCDTPFRLIGITRKPNTGPVEYGVINKGKSYYQGIEVSDLNEVNCEWRKENLQVVKE